MKKGSCSERNLCNCVKKPEKIQDFNRVWARDLAIIGAMLYQMNYEATDVGSRSIVGSYALHKLRSLRRSFLHFISAVHIWFISYIINNHFFHGNVWTHNWPAPNVSDFIAQLVEHRTGNREVTGSNPVEVLNFFQALRNCINCVHCDDHFFIFSRVLNSVLSTV